MKAQFERDTAIKRAGFLAETEEAKARAAQAGPLAEAQASQEVIQQQTALAQRQAELAAQRLEAEVRRPADAEAYRKRTLAEADRDQARFAADAESYRERITAEAEADANKARADSLRDGNQELIAASRLVEILPSLVDAAARGLAESNLTILNGTQGVNEILTGLVGQGLSVLETLKKSAATANGTTPPPVPRAPVPPTLSEHHRSFG
jgi:flotillin